MTTEQKLQAMQALVPFIENAALVMRHPGDWFCALKGVEIKDGATLTSPTSRAPNPFAAIEDLWKQLTILRADQYLVLNAMKDNRRAVRWNGFMWTDVKEEVETAGRR